MSRRVKKKPISETEVSLVNQWESSGQTRRQFCKELNLDEGGFYRLVSRYKKEQAIENSGFIEVKLDQEIPPKKEDVIIEILSQEGMIIRIPSQVGAEYIRTLIRISGC
jgi:hypothetical protein